MATTSPLVFRPSPSHRMGAILLCMGSWLVGVRTLVSLFQRMPSMYQVLQATQAAGESTFWLWTGLVLVGTACLMAGALLLVSLLALLLVEGCQVLVDDLGILVEYTTLPGGLARRMGAGRLGWKEIDQFDQRRFFFVLRGSPEKALAKPIRLRILLVDQFDRLVHLVLERSPNLRFD